MGHCRTALSIIAFYLVTSAGAAPNRVERSKCPEDRLLVYVNMTVSDRTAHQISKIGANSLLDCTQKCYNNPLCSSVKYREADPLSCLLANFAPDSCHHITLVPVAEIKHDTHALITIDCIECKSVEESAETGFLMVSEPDNATEQQPVPESKPCMEGSDCVVAWAQNGTAQAAPTLSTQSLSTQSNTSAPPNKICDPSSQRCREDILFTAKELDESGNLDFLDESIGVNSALECAEKCFETCCQVAVYSATEKKCHFTRKDSSAVTNDSCEAKPITSFVNQYSGSQVEITCVTCGLASKLGHHGTAPPESNALATEYSQQSDGASGSAEVEKPSELVEGFQSNNNQQPTISSAIDVSSVSQHKDEVPQLSRHDPRFMERACIIVFEVDPNVNLNYFRGHDHTEAGGADHCAYLCYRDACTGALFTPSAVPGKKGICERRFNGAEKCNGTLRRDYYYKTSKPVYLQCFRCLPEKPQTKPPLEATTLRSEAPVAVSKQIIASEAAAQPTIVATTPGATASATTTAPIVTITKAAEAGEKEIEKGVPGSVASKPASGSTETSGSGEERKENAPRAEVTGEVGAGKSSEASAEETAKSGEQPAEPDTEATEVEAKVNTTETKGERVPTPITAEHKGTSDTVAPAIPKYGSVNTGPATPETTPSAVTGGRSPEATSFPQGPLEVTIPASSSKGLTPPPEASPATQHGSTSEGGSAPFETTPHSTFEAVREETASTNIAGGEVPATAEYGSAGGSESKPPGAAPPITAAEQPESTTSAAGARVQPTAKYEFAPAVVSHEGGGTPGPVPPSSTAQKITTHIAQQAESTSTYESTLEAGKKVSEEVTTSGGEKKAPSVHAETTTEAGTSGHHLSAEAKSREITGVTAPSTSAHGSEQKASSTPAETATEAGTSGHHVSAEAESREVTGAATLSTTAHGGEQKTSSAPAETATEAGTSGHHASAEAESRERTGVAKPATTTDDGRVGAELYSGSPAMIPSSIPPTIHAHSNAPKNAENIQGSRDEDTSVETAESSAESEKSSIEAKSSKELEMPSESQTEAVHSTTVATDAATPKAEGQSEAVIKFPAATVVVAPAATDKPKAPAHGKSHNVDAPVLSKSSAPYEFLQGCIVTFQADPYSEHPAESSTGFQASTIARTSEVCAGRCYQDGCTGAKYDPVTKECVLGYGGKQICNRGPERFFYEANETVWIHCTGCKLHKPGDAGVNILVDPSKAKAEEKIVSTATEAIVTAAATKGTEKEALTTESSKAEATTGTTVAVAPETPESESSKAVTEKTEEVATTTSGKSNESKEELTKELLSTVLPAFGEAEEKIEHSTSPSSTSVASALSSTVPTESSMSPAENATAEVASTVAKKAETPKEELNIDAVPIAVGEEVVTKEEGLPVGTTPSGTTLIGHGCVVSFQAGPIATRPSEFTSEFIPKGIAPNAQECAKRCYTEGCTGAKFDPANRECSLTFGDHQQCDGNEEEHHSVEATETLWIHCISCKQEFTDSTLELLSEDTTVSAVSTERRNEEGSSTTVGGNTWTPKPSEAEEEFLSVVNQDATLESGNHTGSKVTLQTGEKSMDGMSETSKEESRTQEPTEVSTSPQAKNISPNLGPVPGAVSAFESVSARTTRLPASVSEIKSEETTVAEEARLDTTPVVVILDVHGTTPSESLSAETKKESGERSESAETVTKGLEDVELSTGQIIEGDKPAVDVNMVSGIASTEPSIVEKVAKTINSDELETTILPELLISMTAQPPLSVPIDTSKILGSTSENSERNAAVPTAEEGTTIEPAPKKIEVSEQQKEKALFSTTEFQHELTPSSVPVEINIAHGEVTAHPETRSSEARVHDELGSDNIIGAVSNANVVNDTKETVNETSDLDATIGTSEKASIAPRVEVASSDRPETATTKTYAAITASNVAETAQAESHTEVTSSDTALTGSESHTAAEESDSSEAFTAEAHNEMVSQHIPDRALTVGPSEVTSNAGVTGVTEENQEHSVVTSGLTERTPEKTENAGGTLFSGTAANSITEQSPLQESVDDNIRKVIQAASESGVTVVETVPAEEKAMKKAEGELGAVANVGATDSAKIDNDKSTKEVEGQEAEGDASRLLPLDLTTAGAVAAEGRSLANNVIQTVRAAHVSVKNAIDLRASGEQATTEPPVQAVSDLVNVLSQNSKIEDVIERAATLPRFYAEKQKEKESFAVDDASVIKDKDEQKLPNIAITHLQEGSAETAVRSGTKMSPFQGTATGCPGRIEFEVSAVGELPRLNVSNEVAVESPADCARRCYEAAECVLAGFVPRPSGESTSAVCLLTSDVGICSLEEKSISQHTSGTSFIISCLRCSKCNYTVSAVTELTRIHQADTVEPVLSIGQCAEACSKRNCAVAQYSHKSNLCSLTSVKRQEECAQETPIAVDGEEPVLLECVRCFA